jgi:formamidopyrimidine-DNA glycosylase
MPEYPDIVAYLKALETRVVNQKLLQLRITSPFLLRSAVPPVSSLFGKRVIELRRMGKRICFGFEGELWLVLHLMIAGRLHWREGKPKTSKIDLAAFEFENGTLTLTEAGSRKRASLRVVQGEAGLQELDPGGLEIFESDLAQFSRVLRSSNHTLKRALSDPHLFSGIGNAYSDEILFYARLSPFALTQKLDDEEVARLFEATRSTLTDWSDRFLAAASDSFPEKVTAFRPEMAVHGKYKEPCPRCGTRIQRIRYASNETNYCPTCQTGGRLLADRSLSLLLKKDWPRTPEELEERKKS